METTKFELPFAKKDQLTKDTYTFYFDRVKRGFAENFDYHAGQYFRVSLPIENPDERGSSRYFTISSSPTDEFLTITTRIIQSSFKMKLNSLKPGEKMTFFGPFGDMFQDEEDSTPKIFLAGGIGLNPSHSMLRFIDNKKLNVNFTLVVSFSLKEEVIFYEELKEIEKRNPTVKIVYALTKEQNSYPGFETRRIDGNLIKKYAQDIVGSKFFISGPPVMVEAIENIVKEMGVEEKKIVAENFTGY